MSEHLVLDLATHVPVQSVDLTAFKDAMQYLLTRIQSLDSATNELKAENHALRETIAELSHQALISQDQYGSLYETVHDGVSKIAKLQLVAYEKSQAAQEFSQVQKEIQLLKEEAARLEHAKIDSNSTELEARVQQTAADATARLVQKFERDSREWTSQQMNALEDRFIKGQTQRMQESESKIDQKILATQTSLEEIAHREGQIRKDLENQTTNITNVMRIVAGKLECHEKQLESVEDDVYQRIDACRGRMDVFLEHCIGITWPALLNSISVSSSLVTLDLRRVLMENTYDDVYRRGVVRLKRQIENFREWKRLSTINSRVLLGLGEITRKLESSEEQMDSTGQARLNQRRTEEVTLETRRREEFEAQVNLLREFMVQLSRSGSTADSVVDPSLVMHPAVECLKHMLETPLFAHVRSSLSKEISQSLALTREQFGQEYSNQLALVNKELRQKATLLGLEDTVREYTQRTMAQQLENLESRLETVRGSYVNNSTLMELLKSKADTIVVDRKADAIAVEKVQQALTEQIESDIKKTMSDVQSMVLSRITEVSKDMVSKRDPKIQMLLSGTDENSSTAHGRGNSVSHGGSISVMGANAPQRKCLTCHQDLTTDGAGRSVGGNISGASPATQELQQAQSQIHQAQMEAAPSSAALQAKQQSKDSDAVAAKLASLDAVSSPLVITQPAFKVKDWADDVERKYSGKEKRTPRPPSAKARV